MEIVINRKSIEAAVNSGADLSGANLYRANLSGADLSGADLSGADLSDAHLYRANLSRANLYRANLYRANLSGAYLSDKTNPIIDVKEIGNIGSRGGYIIAFRCEKSIEIHCGCYRGTIQEFETQVKKTHGDTEYMAMIDFLKKIWG